MQTDHTSQPRFRTDLVAQPIEEGGHRFIDVTDPDSGTTFRFYEVEYSIACAMDGRRTVDGLLDWARAELGLEASADELGTVISTLDELGYLDRSGAEDEDELILGASGSNAGVATLVPAGARATVEDVSLGRSGAPAGATRGEPLPPAEHVELGRPGGQGRAAVVPGSDDDIDPDEDLVLAPGGAVTSAAVTARVPAEQMLAGAMAAGKASAAGPALGAAGAPARPAGARRPGDESSFEGLLDEEDITTAAPPTRPQPQSSGDIRPPAGAAAAAPPAARPPVIEMEPLEIVESGVHQAANGAGSNGAYPGSITPPSGLRAAPARAGSETDDEEVSVNLSDHLSIGAADIKEAVRQSRAMSAVSLPPGLEDELDTQTTETTRPVTAPPPLPPVASAPLRAVDQPAAPIELPSRVPLPAAPAADEPELAPAASGGKRALLLVLLLAVLAAGGYVYYTQFMTSEPAPTGRRPGPPAAAGGAAAGAAARAADKLAGPPSAQLIGAPATPVEVTAPAAGAIEFIEADGATVEKDAAVIRLEGYARLLQKVNDSRQRERYYQDKFDRAVAQGKKGQLAGIERKLNEKKALVTELEKALGQLVVLAPAAGLFRPQTEPAAAITAGQIVGRIEPPTQLTARFTLDAGASLPASGATIRIAAVAATDRVVECTVTAAEEGSITVSCPSGTLNSGDQVQLVP
jgi:hypothetical protein